MPRRVLVALCGLALVIVASAASLAATPIGSPMQARVPDGKAVRSIDLCSAYKSTAWLLINGGRVPLQWDLFLNTLSEPEFADLLRKDNGENKTNTPWSFMSASADYVVFGNQTFAFSYTITEHSGGYFKPVEYGLNGFSSVYVDSALHLVLSSGAGSGLPDLIVAKKAIDRSTYSPALFQQPIIKFTGIGTHKNLCTFHDEEHRVSYAATMVNGVPKTQHSEVERRIVLYRVSDGGSEATSIGSFTVPKSITLTERELERANLSLIKFGPVLFPPALLVGDNLIFFEEQPWCLALPSPPADATTWAYCVNPNLGYVYLFYSTAKQKRSVTLITYDFLQLVGQSIGKPK